MFATHNGRKIGPKLKGQEQSNEPIPQGDRPFAPGSGYIYPFVFKSIYLKEFCLQIDFALNLESHYQSELITF